ncbi:hypothetical protein N658DRAFT_7412 [Parathielavia hyrcaniae]|uniref:Uncharacterized protein n=1 Tax=Parathielavia hyrcaniae TaxID=113614 RepID=A0AAN6QC73_9PEZI|nr:hypothetical protein N658DRAFT_7412 [Parathielavia hyrcaniae]
MEQRQERSAILQGGPVPRFRWPGQRPRQTAADGISVARLANEEPQRLTENGVPNIRLSSCRNCRVVRSGRSVPMPCGMDILLPKGSLVSPVLLFLMTTTANIISGVSTSWRSNAKSSFDLRKTGHRQAHHQLPRSVATEGPPYDCATASYPESRRSGSDDSGTPYRRFGPNMCACRHRSSCCSRHPPSTRPAVSTRSVGLMVNTFAITPT